MFADVSSWLAVAALLIGIGGGLFGLTQGARRAAAAGLCALVFLSSPSANSRADLRHDGSPDQDHLDFGQRVQQITNNASLWVMATYQGSTFYFSATRLTPRLALVPMHAFNGTNGEVATIMSVGNGIDYLANPGDMSPVYRVHLSPGWNPNNPFGGDAIDCAVLEIDLHGADAAFDFVGPLMVRQALNAAGRGRPGTPSTGYAPQDGKLRGFEAPVLSFNPGNVSDVFYTSLDFEGDTGLPVNGKGSNGDSGGVVMREDGRIVGMMVASSGGLNSLGTTNFLDFTKPPALKQLQRLIAQIPNAAVAITSITRLPNGHVLLEGTSIPGFSITIQAKDSLDPEPYADLMPSVTADAAGWWEYEAADAVGAANRIYRATLP